MEEDKTKLYYAVRAIKDYLEDGVLTEDDISYLPVNLLNVIHSSVDEITALYKASDYDIVSQYFDKKSELTQTDWEILFTLIRLGHYEVSESHHKEVIDFYNETFYCRRRGRAWPQLLLCAGRKNMFSCGLREDGRYAGKSLPEACPGADTAA